MTYIMQKYRIIILILIAVLAIWAGIYVFMQIKGKTNNIPQKGVFVLSEMSKGRGY